MAVAKSDLGILGVMEEEGVLRRGVRAGGVDRGAQIAAGFDQRRAQLANPRRLHRVG